MAKQTLTVDVAVELLTAIGCDSDPATILNMKTNFRPGEEVEVRELSEFQFLSSPNTATASAHEIAASKVKVKYYVVSRKGYVEGTLLGMLFERLRDYKEFSKYLPKDVR